MKSFFNFLRSNKAYTAIDVFGLSISFMFVILIGAYAWQETHIDHWQSKADRIYALGFDNGMTSNHWAMQPHLRGAFPEIESTTAVQFNEPGFHIGDNDILTKTMFVDSTFLDIFDIELVAGDRATALDDMHSAIISEKYALANFGDGDPIGKRFSWQADSVYFIVAGVMKAPTQTMFEKWDHSPIDVIARIEMMKHAGANWVLDPDMGQIGGTDVWLLAAPGVDLTQKVDEYQKFMKQFHSFRNLGEPDAWSLEVYPLKTMYYEGIKSMNSNHRHGDKNLIKMLAAVGGVVLLFALLNYVNLTVALAGKRAKEMATRRLMGSSRAAIVGRLIGESALLCALSMVIGIGLAFGLEPYAFTVLEIYIDIKPCITPATIGIMFGIFALMSVVAGIIPAILISDNKPIDVVRGTFRRRTKMVYSKVIIVVQNTITIAMIVVTLGMYMQVRHLVNAPLGYDPKEMLIVRNIGIGDWRMQILREEFAKLPSIRSISATMGNPLTGCSYNQWEVDGKSVRAATITADSTIFEFWGIEKIRDNHVPQGVWVTPGLLATLGLDEDAQDFQYGGDRVPIAGVVKDFHIGSILDPQREEKMIVLKQINSPWALIMKYDGDPAEVLAQVREIYDGVSPVPLDQDYYFGDEYIKQNFTHEQNLTAIMATFAIVAILISLLGLLAISTYYVQQREREIAVRKVFGSTASGIIRKVTRTFVVYVIISFVLAVPLAYHVLGEWLSQFSYRIPVYWWLFAVALGATLGITALTVYAQSRHAANSNPINTLKQN